MTIVPNLKIKKNLFFYSECLIERIYFLERKLLNHFMLVDDPIKKETFKFFLLFFLLLAHE